MRSPDLWTAVVRSRRRKGRLERLHRWWHPVRPRHKRLCLGVESVIPIVASRDWMLALGIMRVYICRQLPKCVRNSTLRRRAARSRSSRRIRCGTEPRLPVRWRSTRQDGRAICCHRAPIWRVPLLHRLRRIRLGRSWIRRIWRHSLRRRVARRLLVVRSGHLGRVRWNRLRVKLSVRGRDKLIRWLRHPCLLLRPPIRRVLAPRIKAICIITPLFDRLCLFTGSRPIVSRNGACSGHSIFAICFRWCLFRVSENSLSSEFVHLFSLFSRQLLTDERLFIFGIAAILRSSLGSSSAAAATLLILPSTHDLPWQNCWRGSATS